MLKVDLNLKKASVRTMLPVASAGFSCLWGMLLVVLLSPSAPQSGEELLLLRLGFIVGAFVMMIVVYVKRDLIAAEGPDPVPAFAVVLCLFLGVTNLLFRAGVEVPFVVEAIVWALAGCGFSLILLEWPKVFMVAWRKDVGMFLAAGAALGAVVYLFAVNLAPPYADIALVLLPLASVLVFRYVVSHIVVGARSSEKQGEQTKLFLLTGFTVLLFGLLFGIGLYTVSSHMADVNPVFVTVAVALGAGVHIALALFVKHYISFGTAEKFSLLCCAAGFLAMEFLSAEWKVVCGLFLVAVWIYLDFANMSALMGFASGHASPFWRISRGQFVLVLGVGISWAACLVIDTWFPDLFSVVPLFGLGVVLVLAMIAVLKPFQDNAFADKNADGEVAEGGFFTQRCQKVAADYKLSEREGEVLRFLAKGRNAQFISEQLNISAYTVKTHVYHIYQKMGVNSQQELITIVDATEVEYH